MVQIYVWRRLIIADNIGMENKSKPTSKEMLEKMRKLGIDKEVEFYFVPSQELRNRIARGGDPILDQLPESAKKIILTCPPGKGISQYNQMVLKYIEGTLDKRNSYVFDLGEIRVQNANELMIKCLNRSVNNEIKGLTYKPTE